MAMRGAFIGRGYVSKFGMVAVFSDMDNKNFFFVQRLKGTRVGEKRYVARSQVEFRK